MEYIIVIVRIRENMIKGAELKFLIDYSKWMRVYIKPEYMLLCMLLKLQMTKFMG